MCIIHGSIIISHMDCSGVQSVSRRRFIHPPLLGATPVHTRSNNLAGRSISLALPCLALHIALLR